MLAVNGNEQCLINPVELRRAFGTFATGITVVTTREADGAPRGMTANSFTSVSLDPPLLLVCIGKTASSFPAFNAADSFAVNVLSERQKAVASIFASKSVNKFESIRHHSVHTGAPVLADCLTWFDCTVHDRVDAGDHVILIGRVRAFETAQSAPLGFWRGRYVSVEDATPPMWSRTHRMRIGYLVEHQNRILLCSDDAGGWNLPTATSHRAANIVDLGDEAVLALSEDAFLYSVFDVTDQASGYVVYRGVMSGRSEEQPKLPPSLKFFALDELPWDRIPIRQVRTMLHRYLQERRTDRFGIYVDTSSGGRVAMIDGAPGRWLNPVGHNVDYETVER